MDFHSVNQIYDQASPVQYLGLDAQTNLVYPKSSPVISVDIPFYKWQLIDKSLYEEGEYSTHYYIYRIPHDLLDMPNKTFGIFCKDQNGKYIYTKETNVLSGNEDLLGLLQYKITVEFSNPSYVWETAIQASQFKFTNILYEDQHLVSMFFASSKIVPNSYPLASLSKYGPGIYFCFTDCMTSTMRQIHSIELGEFDTIEFQQKIEDTSVPCYPVRLNDYSQKEVFSYACTKGQKVTQAWKYTYTSGTASGYCGSQQVNELPIYTSIMKQNSQPNLIQLRKNQVVLNEYKPPDAGYLFLWTMTQNKFLNEVTIDAEVLKESNISFQGTKIITSASSTSDHDVQYGDVVFDGAIDGARNQYIEDLSQVYLYEDGKDPQNMSEDELRDNIVASFPLRYEEEGTYYTFSGTISANFSRNYLLVIDYANHGEYQEEWYFSNVTARHGWTPCLYKDSLVTLSDYTQKRMQDLTFDDILLDKDKNPVSIVKIDTNQKNTHKTLYYFDDGTIVTITNKHRFYNIDQGFYQYLHLWNIGDHAQKIDGTTPALVKSKVIDENCTCYGLWTETGTYWAENLLSSETHANEECLEEGSPELVVNIMKSMIPSALAKGINDEKNLYCD